MNITIDTEDSQEMLEYYRMKVEVIEKDVTKSIARLKRYQAIVDQLEEREPEPDSIEEQVDVTSSEADHEDTGASDVVDDPTRYGVKLGTKRGPYKSKGPKNELSSNVIAGTHKEAVRHFAAKRNKKSKNQVEDPEKKTFQRPPASYSNNKSLYPEMNSPSDISLF